MVSVSLNEEGFATQFISQDLVDHALHGCPRICSYLGLQGLACLAASSKGLQETCHAAVSCDCTSLLGPALEAARAGQLLNHTKDAAAWVVALLQGMGTSQAAEAAAAVSCQLTALPSVPLDWAVQLVAAGVRIHHTQLLAAASSMLAGVEVWVRAQQQLGVQTDIPAASTAGCCGDDWVSHLCTTATSNWLCCSVKLRHLQPTACDQDTKDVVQLASSWPPGMRHSYNRK